MKDRFEKWLIKKLLNGSSLDEKDINTERRTVYLGLWAMAIYWMDPHHKLILSILVKWYKYKCYQSEFIITSTWCNINADKISDRFFEWNKEFEERRKLKSDGQ